MSFEDDEEVKVLCVIHETPVPVFEDYDCPQPLRKRLAFLSHTEKPPSESVMEKRSLEDYTTMGYFGYIFRYETDELVLHQW